MKHLTAIALVVGTSLFHLALNACFMVGSANAEPEPVPPEVRTVDCSVPGAYIQKFPGRSALDLAMSTKIVSGPLNDQYFSGTYRVVAKDGEIWLDSCQDKGQLFLFVEPTRIKQ